jgi:hypothetical protein
MRTLAYSSVMTLALVFLFATVVEAQDTAPPYIPVQGYLTDDDDEPLNGTIDITFSIYQVETGGSARFSELQSVKIVDGRFTAYIGDRETLDLELFKNGDTLFIGIEVGDNDEMKPRIQLATAPYAGFAQYCGEASTLEGMSVEDLLSWDNITGIPQGVLDGGDTITNVSILEGGGLQLDDEGQLSIAESSVTTQQILDGTISSEDVDTDAFAIKTGSTDQSFDDGTLYLDYGDHRVGIRTDDPRSALDVDGAISSTEYLLSNPRMTSRYLSAEEFQPDIYSGILALYAGNSTASRYLYPPYRLTNGGGGVAVAPFTLPDGAEIRSVSCYYFDNDSVDDIGQLRMRLLAAPYDCFEDNEDADTTCVRTLAQGEPPDTAFLNLEEEAMQSHELQVPSDDSNPVNNRDFRYGMHIYFNSTSPGRALNLRFYGCKLDYDVLRLTP